MPGHLRTSRDDREQVVSLLRVAYVQGRLTKDEFDQRLAKALAPGTYAELAALTADLAAPAGGPLTPAADRLRVHVSYSPADNASLLLRRRLASSFDVVRPEMFADAADRRAALRRSIMCGDVAVIILPEFSDPSWRDVLFEAGAIAGGGGPFLLAGHPGSVPAGLASYHVFPVTHTDEIIDTIVQIGPRSRKWLFLP